MALFTYNELLPKGDKLIEERKMTTTNDNPRILDVLGSRDEEWEAKDIKDLYNSVIDLLQRDKNRNITEWLTTRGRVIKRHNFRVLINNLLYYFNNNTWMPMTSLINDIEEETDDVATSEITIIKCEVYDNVFNQFKFMMVHEDPKIVAKIFYWLQ